MPPAAEPTTGGASARVAHVAVSGHDGVRVRVEVHNAGSPAVVLFQAGLGLPGSVWHPVIDLLPGACALVVDRPGLAGCPPWDRTPGLADQVSLVTDVLAACSPARTGPVLLVGHSYAGLIVEAFARTNPEQVAGLVLVDPSLPAHEVATTSLTERFPAAARALAGLGPRLGPRVGRWLGLAVAAGGTVGLGATGPTARDLADAFADPDHRRATVDELARHRRGVRRAARAGCSGAAR